MRKILIAFVLIFGIAILQAKSQDKVKSEKLIRKVELRNDGSKVQLKIIENGETVVDKSYDSMEDLKADETLKEYNVGIFGAGEHKIIFKSADGNVHKLGDETNIWVKEEHSSRDKDVEMFFNSGDGVHVNITKDANGNMVIERNGEVVDIEAIHGESIIKLKKLDDGTFLIENENGSKKISPEELKSGAVFVTDGVFKEEGGTIHFKDGDGNVTIDLIGEGTWVMDGLHDADHNVMFFETQDIETDGEHQIIIEKKIDSENGEMVKIIIERIHLKISDVDDLKVVEEIPGSNVVSNNMLQLEEVNYYPNPNTGVFNLQFGAKELPTQIRVIDMMGKEAYSETIPGFKGRYDKSIDLSGNEKGMYILQILQGEKTWNKKIVIE